MPHQSKADLASSLEREAHLYMCDPAAFTDEQLRQMQSVLSDDEMARMRAFRFDDDRNSYLVTHAMLRNALSHYLDAAPADWRFVYSDHGKPSLGLARGDGALHFNMTHTRGLSAVVIAGGECGIDAEHLTRDNNIDAIAQRMFSAQEVDYMRADAGRARRRFFMFWTLREAYVKATGRGLGGNSDAFQFSLDDAVPAASISFVDESAAASTDWYFRILTPTAQHVVSVCTGRPCTVVVRESVGL